MDNLVFVVVCRVLLGLAVVAGVTRFQTFGSLSCRLVGVLQFAGFCCRSQGL